jgi:hypothetical protein
MSQKYIVDSCIWRDFYEDRISKIGRPLGSYAYNFFLKVLRKNCIILFSDALIWELRKYYDEAEVISMINFIARIGSLKRIEITSEDDLEAQELCARRNIPRIDCLNAVHARNHQATLISQDKHVIHMLSDICLSSRPEMIS